jgi:hypothetical protein
VTAINQNAISNNRSVAVTLAQGTLQQILALPDSDSRFKSSTTIPSPWDLDSETSATSLAVNGGTYLATWAVTTDSPVSKMVRIDVTINGPQGRKVTVTGYKRVL